MGFLLELATPAPVRTVVLVSLAAVALYGLHRLAAWGEDRGWIYYRRGRGRSGSLSGAALQVQSLLQPSAEHVVEERRRQQLARDEAGDSDLAKG